MIKDKFKNRVRHLKEQQEFNPWASARKRGPYAKASQVYSQARKDVEDVGQRAPAVARGAARMLVPGYTGVEKLRQGDTKGGLIDLGIDAATVGLATKVPGLKSGIKGALGVGGKAATAAAKAASKVAPNTRSGIANAAKTVGRQVTQTRIGQKLAGMASDVTKRSGLADKAKNLRNAAKERLANIGSAKRDMSGMQGGATKAVNRQGPSTARQARQARQAKQQQTVMGTERANRLALKSQAIRQAAKDAPLTKGAGPAGRGAGSQAAQAVKQRKAQQTVMGTERANRIALKSQALRQAAREAPTTRNAGPAGRGGASQAARAATQRRNNAIASKQTNQRNAMSRVVPKPVAGKTSGMPPSSRPDLAPGQKVATVAAATAANRIVSPPTRPQTASQTSGQPDSARPDKPMGQFQAPSAAAAPKPATQTTAPAKQQVQKAVQQKSSNSPMSVSAYAKQRSSYTGKNLQGQPSVQAGRIATAKAALNTTGGGAKGNMMRQRAQRDLYGPDR